MGWFLLIAMLGMVCGVAVIAISLMEMEDRHYDG